MRWGRRIFETEAVIRITGKYLLSGIYMSVITLGIIALCVYTRNTWKTIFIIIIYMLMDLLICNTSVFFLKKLWIGYYLNLWLFSYEYLGIPLKEAIEGIVIIAMYGVFFYHTSLSRMKKWIYRGEKMVTELLKIQFKRLNRQKLLCLYFIVMAAFITSNALQCAGSPEDTRMAYYAGGRFPTLCLQSYIDIIGALFLSFVSAILISGEKASGMLKQPLLNGISKKQLLTAKIASILIVELVCFLFVILFSVGIGSLFWSSHIFDNIQEFLLRILLLTFPQITTVLFLVLLSLYMSNISSMMCASLIILLLNNLFSQFWGNYVSFIDFMYYLYAFSGYNGIALETDRIALGIAVNIVTGVILFYGIIRRTNHMTL